MLAHALRLVWLDEGMLVSPVRSQTLPWMTTQHDALLACSATSSAWTTATAMAAVSERIEGGIVLRGRFEIA